MVLCVHLERRGVGDLEARGPLLIYRLSFRGTGRTRRLRRYDADGSTHPQIYPTCEYCDSALRPTFRRAGCPYWVATPDLFLISDRGMVNFRTATLRHPCALPTCVNKPSQCWAGTQSSLVNPSLHETSAHNMPQVSKVSEIAMLMYHHQSYTYNHDQYLSKRVPEVRQDSQDITHPDLYCEGTLRP